MLDAGETIVPRTCPVHGIYPCRVGCAYAPPLAPYDPNVRKGDWMQTASGRQFWPLDPRPEEIHIEDIAAHLSKLCRYGGALRDDLHYSVAEHCVHVARAAPAHLKFTALLHDASEAYLQDVIRPIKRHLANYEPIEAELERSIAIRFGLSWPWDPEVKRLDARIVNDEIDQALTHPTVAWRVTTEPALGIRLQFWSPATARREFLRAFDLYSGKA